MALVTVGLPFLDARDSLGDAIRSVFAQTHEDWELLLVDDGSTDGSLEIARSVRDPRVRVLSDGEHRRLPARLNEIVRASRADLVARLDADDMMHPERLARQVRILTEAPSTDFVGTACFTLDARGDVMGVVASEPVVTEPRHVLRRGLLGHATLLFRRAWCLDNPYSEDFPRAEDRELYCRTLGAARFAQIREPLYFVGYRKDARTTLRDYVATSRDNRRIYARHAPRLTGLWSVAPLLVESWVKEAAFRAATAMGHQRSLLRRRGRAATPAEREEAEKALATVRAVSVEGLPAEKGRTPTLG